MWGCPAVRIHLGNGEQQNAGPGLMAGLHRELSTSKVSSHSWLPAWPVYRCLLGLFTHASFSLGLGHSVEHL